MKLRRLATALAPLLAFALFLAFGGAVGAADNEITIQIGEQNGSGQSGTATLTDLGNGSTRVVVNLRNSPAGPQPIHIHRGTCANLDPAVRFPLQNLMNGKSESTVPAALSAILAEPHAINAHKSPQEPAIYVACGDITAAGMPSMPRSGAGGMARPAVLPWGLAAAILTLVWGGGAYAVRRRA